MPAPCMNPICERDPKGREVLAGDRESNDGTKDHSLKCWPEPFEAIVRGAKRHEYRLDDRAYNVGDTLTLMEWDPETRSFSGRVARVRVTYLTRGPEFGVSPGYIAMSIAPVWAESIR
jgi:hypothetical protein